MQADCADCEDEFASLVSAGTILKSYHELQAKIMLALAQFALTKSACKRSSQLKLSPKTSKMHNPIKILSSF